MKTQELWTNLGDVFIPGCGFDSSIGTYHRLYRSNIGGTVYLLESQRKTSKLASEVKHLVNDLFTLLGNWKGTEENMQKLVTLLFHTILLFVFYQQVYMILRPHVKEFLQSMAKIFEVFFTVLIWYKIELTGREVEQLAPDMCSLKLRFVLREMRSLFFYWW